MQQDAKNEILARLKNGKPASHPLPEVPMYAWHGDPLENFLKELIGFDGRAVQFKTREDAVKWLMAQPEMDATKQRIYSSAQGVAGNVTEEDVADLRNAHTINTCVTESELAVGEMGSVWVTDASLNHAACALLSRRLFVLLDAASIVGGMHEAYARLKLREHQYGSFYTGPSATADIEAVHITGAQGPLSLTALIYNCKNAPATPHLLVNPHADTSIWQKNMENDA